MRNMAVSGECITPHHSPFLPGQKLQMIVLRMLYWLGQHMLRILKLPIRSEGANIPPIPPEPFVIAMAITLKNSTKTKK